MLAWLIFSLGLSTPFLLNPDTSGTFGILPSINYKTLSEYSILKELDSWYTKHRDPLPEFPGGWFEPLSGPVQRQCLTKSKLDFVIKEIQYIKTSYAASECCVNKRFPKQSMISSVGVTPYPNIHEMINLKSDPLLVQLERNIINSVYRHQKGSLMADSEVTGVKSDCKDTMTFYNFLNLDYGLRCTVDYFDIMQVLLKQTGLKVIMERKFYIDENCGLGVNNLEAVEIIEMTIPIEGELVCHKGRSKTCKRDDAVSV
ncbi:hypothetical protein BABINDRAFT_177053 [Babjeviella inositovora NRRL Y-12698]|uniref:Uncharacterized protein n=1 Tax=Babjeviella inositovora NRRL Y-12698 TaxID=984486 RepID=A0A1E3QPD9_9ASCO|nr:uncharacterized protein BABINDRAFT_177053 [Babjeviella inositovora NRRL Y-12698]ODQ78847.1 hypothetical protein BABINDRAFT_177053 [Babjeviella inositovora NRRL Y-12698]